MLYLHAGSHKTGTSSIQATFFANRENLCRLGVNYFEYAENHSMPILWAFSARSGEHPVSLQRRLSPNDVKRISGEVRDALDAFLADMNCPTKIISGEEISNLPAEELSRLKQYIDRFDQKVRLIFYVRNYFDYLSSQVQELVKWGWSLQKLKEGIVERQLIHPHFGRSIAKLATVFGAQNVDVRFFHRERLAGGDLIRDFCEATGSEHIHEQLAKKVSNESMSATHTYLLSDYNDVFPPAVNGLFNIERSHNAAAYLAGYGNPKYRLADQDVLSAYACNVEQDADKVAEVLGEGARELLMQKPELADFSIGSSSGAASRATYGLAIRKMGRALVDLEDTDAILDMVLSLFTERGPVNAKVRDLVLLKLPLVRDDALCRRMGRALLRIERFKFAELAAKRALQINEKDERNSKLLADVERAIAKLQKRSA